MIIIWWLQYEDNNEDWDDGPTTNIAGRVGALVIPKQAPGHDHQYDYDDACHAGADADADDADVSADAADAYMLFIAPQ